MFIVIIYQVVHCFHNFLRPFDNYILFFLQLFLSFQPSSINPFSPINPLIPFVQVSLGLPRFLLPGGRNILRLRNVPEKHIHAVKNTTICQIVSQCNKQHYVIYIT
jgi:hypothetical protein